MVASLARMMHAASYTLESGCAGERYPFTAGFTLMHKAGRCCHVPPSTAYGTILGVSRVSRALTREISASGVNRRPCHSHVFVPDFEILTSKIRPETASA